MDISSNLITESEIEPIPLSTYRTNHHCDGYFCNDIGEPTIPKAESPSLKEAFKFAFGKPDYSKPAPFRKISPEEFHLGPGIRFWWIGHATCLIQFGNTFIITDPIFSKYGAPVIGVNKRVTPPACEISELPPIQYILISHDHYDHLDYPSMKKIHELNPDVIVLTGLGMAEMISGWGIPSIAFDWRQYATLSPSSSFQSPLLSTQNNNQEINSNIGQTESIKIFCMPAHHYTNRKGWDGSKRLWCSFLLEYHNIYFYFPGDTALGPHFQEISQLIDNKPIDLVAIPVGPTEPVNVMRGSHLNPEDSLYACNTLGARVAVPIHWGVFPLGLPPKVHDIEATKAVFEQAGKDNILQILKVGGALCYNFNTNLFEPIQGTDSIVSEPL